MKVPLFTLIPLGILCVFDMLARFTCPMWFDMEEDHNLIPAAAAVSQGNVLLVAEEKVPASPPSDGTFNGFDLYHVNHPPESHVHCIGENFQQDRSWLFRSCEYTTFCFNIDTKQYYIYADEKPLVVSKDVWSSTQVEKKDQLVSAGAQPKTWFPKIAEKKYKIKTRIGSFRPNVVYGGSSANNDNRPTSYYRLNATILPFYRHPKSFQNPGHLIWDDFLSLYTLLDVFDRTDDRIMLSQMIRPSTADFEEQPIPANTTDLMPKFLGLFGKDHVKYNLQTMESFDLKLRNIKESNLRKLKEEPIIICADHAIMGSGTFSDHGESHWHGQAKADFDWPLNAGRGGLFRRYRHFMMENMGVNPRAQIQTKPLYQIVVAAGSSEKIDRAAIDFKAQIDVLNKAFENRAQVSVHNLAKLSAKEQLELASTAAIYITVVGGGSVTGFFLPKGASVFLFYGAKKLDYDVWNNHADIQTHWMPVKTMDAKEDLVSLAELVGGELDYLDDTLLP
mmetsp:Transcript_29661/g.48947  ORF Transcript_29661/g.48947 Transcript_29661/m.48947 type:complete len:506 (-) Transcript_29661:238-1755(-)